MIQFTDKLVSYDTFLSDLAVKIAERLTSIQQQPQYISQRKAYQQYGRANVQRWLKEERIHPHKRTKKIEYNTSELRLCASSQQDYFDYET